MLVTLDDRHNLDGLVVPRSSVISDYKRRCGDKNQRSTNVLCLRGCATLASDAFSLPCSAPPLCVRGKPESEPTVADIAGVVSRGLVALHGYIGRGATAVQMMMEQQNGRHEASDTAPRAMSVPARAIRRWAQPAWPARQGPWNLQLPNQNR